MTRPYAVAAPNDVMAVTERAIDECGERWLSPEGLTNGQSSACSRIGDFAIDGIGADRIMRRAAIGRPALLLKMERIPAMAGILYLLWGASQDRRIRFQFWETQVFL